MADGIWKPSKDGLGLGKVDVTADEIIEKLGHPELYGQVQTF